LPSWYFDLNAQTWTTNAFTSNASVTIMSSGGGGGIVIGSSGELIIQQISGGAPTISAPIRESVANSWVTYGAASKFGNKGLGVLTLSGSNSHTGGTSLVSGSMNINHAYALGSGTFRINGNNITLDNRSGAPLTLATNNYNEWNTDFTFIGTQDLNLGTGTVSLGTWAGSTRTVTVNAGNLTIGGRIVDGSYAALPTTGIAKQGDGTLVLSGSNGYTGGTEVWGGELRFANKNALYGGDTTKWTAANILSGSGAVLSVSVGSGAGAFASGDLDTLAGLGTDSGGFQSGGYLGIDTTNVTGTYTYATNLANPGNSTSGTNALGIAKVGSGTLILSGTNTFTGGVLARGGRLLVTATNQVGPGTLVAAGGLLDLNGLTVSNSFAITSGTIANTTIAANKLSAAVTGPAVISGTLTGAGLGFMKSGTGTLALTGNNDYTGTTTVSAGLLSISSDANIGGTSAPLTFSGGGLQVTGATLTSLATGRTTTFSNNQPVTFEIVDPANTFTVSQPLQMGSGGLTKSGSGALVLSGNNTYTGATTLTGGTLRMGSANALGSGAALTVSGGVLDLNGNAISRSGSITFAGGLVTGGTVTATAVDYQGLSGTVAASLAGTRALVKSGTGVLVLSGSNSYSGITTVNSGSSMGFLQFAQTAALYGGTTTDWTKTKIVVNSGGVFAVSVGGAGEFGTSDVTTLLTGLGGAVNNNGLRAGSSIGFDTTNAGGSFTVTDTIADTTSTGGGAVGLVKLGAGTLILSASNTFTGQTVMGTYNGPNAGSLQLASTGFVSPTVVVYGGTFDTAGQNRTITTLSLGGGAPGSTAGLQTGSGTVTTGSNGVTYVALTGANGATISGNVSLGSASRTFLVNDSPAASVDLAVSAALTSGTLVKTGFGTLGLSGSNSFAGKLQVAQGTVEIDWINNSGNSPLGANTTTDLGSAAVAGTLRWVGTTSGTTSRTFNLSGTAGGGGGIDASGVGALVITSTVTAAAGSKTLTLGGTSTAANEIRSINNPTTGNASVVKDGPGLWRLTGTSGFAGGFTVKNGTIVAGVDTNGGTDAGVFGTSDTVIVGDESSGAAGTASLLLAPGVVSNKLLRVPATTGTQTVVLGGEASGATPRFENQIQLGRNVTLVAATGGTTSFGNTWASTGTAPLSANVSIGSAGRAGAVRLANSLATTGSVAVRFGTLDVLDARTLTAAGIVGIDSGATLAGVGRVAATLGGAGLVAPGNSPGILTADAFDPTGGLDLAFEFTGTAPDYANASASVNDVLRLTGTASAPFTTALTSANEIAVYLDVASLAEGNTFSGGFFTNLAGDFRSSIANAAYSYWVSGTGAGQTTYQSKTYVPLATAYPSLSMDVTTVATTATFSGESPTSGQVTQFTVVVPEPGAFALAALGLGLAGYALRRRRL
jgi:autotransporter-associated beta strand protein